MDLSLELVALYVIQERGGDVAKFLRAVTHGGISKSC
jgi:hypothetical protein